MRVHCWRSSLAKRVLRSMKELSLGKLASIWEGPYHVTGMAKIGAYYLENLEERPIPRLWNVRNLKMYLSIYVNFLKLDYSCFTLYEHTISRSGDVR